MSLFCGINWGTEHHDVGIVDDEARVVARERVDNDAAGFVALLTLLAEAGDPAAIAASAGLADGGLVRADARTVLAAMGSVWAFSAYHQAQRQLFNKFPGQLHHCLQTPQLSDEHRAFPPLSHSRLDF